MLRRRRCAKHVCLHVQVLGQGAVHGAFAGFTGFTVGLVNTHYVYLPIPVIIQDTRKVDPKVRSRLGSHEPLSETGAVSVSCTRHQAEGVTCTQVQASISVYIRGAIQTLFMP